MKELEVAPMTEEDMVRGLLSEARAAVNGMDLGDWNGQDNIEAVMLNRAIGIAEGQRRGLRSIVAKLILRAIPDKLWLAHPPTRECPDGFPDLTAFLRYAGVTGSAVSELAAIGEVIGPYCLPSGDLEEHVSEGNYTRLTATIPALRQAIGDDDDSKVEAILGDVLSAESRSTLRDRYTDRKVHREGGGTTSRLPDGRVAVILLLDGEQEVERVIKKLTGSIEWGLVAEAQKRGRSIRVTINDP